MTESELVRHRLRNERLVGKPFAAPEDAVRWLGAVQSQDYAGAKWALAQRSDGEPTDAALDRVFDDGKLIRTHVLRPTWHFVAPEDLRWMLALSRPRVLQAMSYYHRRHELDADVFARSDEALARALAGGRQLTRAEVASALGAAGIAGTSGERLGHLLMHAELGAIVCSGAMKGKQHTYALVEDRVPPARALSRDAALAELARRYFTSHGPAQLKDYAWWSGLTVADARRGIELAGGSLREVTIDPEGDNGDVRTCWVAADLPARAPKLPRTPLIHLLPNYDELLIAYKDHTAAFDAETLAKLTTRSSAVMAHILILDGKIAGGWRRTVARKAVELRTDMLVTLDKRERAALRDAADRYGRFMERTVTIA